jgi:hypothetical protein
VIAPHVLEGAVTFLNVHEATTLDAMVARIIPGSPEDPGAREAGVLRYIDRALEGPYRDLRPLYRQGLAALDDECLAKHGRGFAELDEPAQDQLLGRLAETEPVEQLVAGEAGEARGRRRRRPVSSPTSSRSCASTSSRGCSATLPTAGTRTASAGG